MSSQETVNVSQDVKVHLQMYLEDTMRGHRKLKLMGSSNGLFVALSDMFWMHQTVRQFL
jgi:hypothetical protein